MGLNDVNQKNNRESIRITKVTNWAAFKDWNETLLQYFKFYEFNLSIQLWIATANSAKEFDETINQQQPKFEVMAKTSSSLSFPENS